MRGRERHALPSIVSGRRISTTWAGRNFSHNDVSRPQRESVVYQEAGTACLLMDAFNLLQRTHEFPVCFYHRGECIRLYVMEGFLI